MALDAVVVLEAASSLGGRVKHVTGIAPWPVEVLASSIIMPALCLMGRLKENFTVATLFWNDFGMFMGFCHVEHWLWFSSTKKGTEIPFDAYRGFLCGVQF